MAGKLKLATAQFAASGDIKTNCNSIIGQIEDAAAQNIEIIHFSESCLTGYPDIDVKECENTPLIAESIEKIAAAANQYDTYVVFGTHYFENQSDELPFNSLFVISNHGETVVRYDKRVLAGAPGEIDQKHFKAGSKEAVFTINGIKCGLIICHEWRYAELFREYKALGVDLLLHSFYDGHQSKSDYHKTGIELGELISGSTRGNAANNYSWISMSNTCKAEQTFPSALIRPDGSVDGSCNRNKAEVLISNIDFSKEYIDPSKYGRLRIKELFRNGLS